MPKFIENAFFNARLLRIFTAQISSWDLNQIAKLQLFCNQGNISDKCIIRYASIRSYVAIVPSHIFSSFFRDEKICTFFVSAEIGRICTKEWRLERISHLFLHILCTVRESSFNVFANETKQLDYNLYMKLRGFQQGVLCLTRNE